MSKLLASGSCAEHSMMYVDHTTKGFCLPAGRFGVVHLVGLGCGTLHILVWSVGHPVWPSCHRELCSTLGVEHLACASCRTPSYFKDTRNAFNTAGLCAETAMFWPRFSARIEAVC